MWHSKYVVKKVKKNRNKKILVPTYVNKLKGIVTWTRVSILVLLLDPKVVS